MNAAATRELFDRYVIPTYARFDLQFTRAEGAHVWDEAGRRYLDFGGGIAVTSVGHCHPRVLARLREQLGTLVHVSNLYYSRPQGELAERLVRLMGGRGKVFFCNSGAEANEALYKLARKFGNEGAPPAWHAYRGRVGPAGAASADGHRDAEFLSRADAGGDRRDWSGEGEDRLRASSWRGSPMCRSMTRRDCWRQCRRTQRRPFCWSRSRANAGSIPPRRSFCGRRAICATGMRCSCSLTRCNAGSGGRDTGAAGRRSRPDLAPDAVSWAKGIAGGFPLGAIWVSDRPVSLKSGATIPLCDLLGPGSHGTTFGGTPLVSAGANEVLRDH